MKLKILTANIAFGLNNMDSLLTNIVGHLIFHGRQMITLFINPVSLKNRKGYLYPRRVKYLKRHSSLKNIIALIREESPDIIMLNELIFQLHKDELQNELINLGYKYFSWGFSEHYADTTVSSFVASKSKAESVMIKFPQESHAGGGAGIASIRFSESNITAISVHMCVSDKFPWLYDAEIETITKFIQGEKSTGREVVIGGDWNASASYLKKYDLFSKSNFINSEGDLPTCPTFFPKLNSLDHVFIPNNWKTLNAKTISFGSDHLAVSVEVEK